MDVIPNNHPKLSVVAPAFNEEECIEPVISQWIGFLRELGEPFEIVIANDGSTDQTGAILKRLAQTFPELEVIGGSVNHGYGAALTSAIEHSTGETILSLDSDGQFAIEDYVALRNALIQSGADCATGIREKKDSVFRVFADGVFRFLCRRLFSTGWRDPNCAIKLTKASALRSLSLEARGYASPSEILFKLNFNKFKIVEIKVQHRERIAGVSKLRFFSAAINMMLFILYLSFKSFLANRKVLYLNLKPHKANE